MKRWSLAKLAPPIEPQTQFFFDFLFLILRIVGHSGDRFRQWSIFKHIGFLVAPHNTAADDLQLSSPLTLSFLYQSSDCTVRFFCRCLAEHPCHLAGWTACSPTLKCPYPPVYYWRQWGYAVVWLKSFVIRTMPASLRTLGETPKKRIRLLMLYEVVFGNHRKVLSKHF